MRTSVLDGEKKKCFVGCPCSFLNGCFQKLWYPQNHPFKNRVFHDFHHPFWGVKCPYFWKKHPNVDPTFLKLKKSQCEVVKLQGFFGETTGLEVCWKWDIQRPFNHQEVRLPHGQSTWLKDPPRVGRLIQGQRYKPIHGNCAIYFSGTQKESSLPTIDFQGRTVKLRRGGCNWYWSTNNRGVLDNTNYTYRTI